MVGVPELVERHVLNVLHRVGDTHGVHFDDYPLAVVIVTEAPPCATDGGLLEYLPQAQALSQLAGPSLRRRYHRPGDAYLLRSDTTAHRVTALRREGVRRVVLNLAYTTPQAHVCSTPSAALLYD